MENNNGSQLVRPFTQKLIIVFLTASLTLAGYGLFMAGQHSVKVETLGNEFEKHLIATELRMKEFEIVKQNQIVLNVKLEAVIQRLDAINETLKKK